MRTLAGLGVLVAGAVLFGCGGGSGGPAPIATPAHAAATKQRVTLKIVIPKSSSAPASNTRRPRYISPATAQMVVNVQTGCPGSCVSSTGYPETVALTTSSGNCTSTLASTNCLLTLALLPGSYTLTLTAEDASGNALSTAQSLPVTILEGQANAISVSLSGIPIALVATLEDQVGDVLVEALDQDDNVIVGPGAPSFSVAQSSGTSATLVQPTTSSPNRFQATLSAAGSAVLQITASYSGTGVTNACAQSGAVCTKTETLSGGATSLFVMNNNSTVTEYAAPFTGSPTTISSGVASPDTIAVDSDNDLFVGNDNGVTEYTSPYTGAPAATMSTGDAVTSLALDASRNLYVAVQGANEVLIFAPPYTGAATTVSSGVTSPPAVAVGPNGDLFVLNSLSGGTVYTIGVYAPPLGAASAPTTTIATGLDNVTDIEVDASGRVYAVNGSTSQVRTWTPPFPGSPTTTTGPVNTPYALAFDPSGNPWITNSGVTGTASNSVQEIVNPFTAVTASVFSPTALAFDAYGNLAIANFNNSVTVYAPPYAGSATSITSGVGSIGEPRTLAFTHPTLSLSP